MNSQLSKNVIKKIKADYNLEEIPRVAEYLGQYGTDKPETERVQIGILNLANRDIPKLQMLVSVALTDYRDLLVQAEYLNDPYNLLQTLLRNLQ